MRSVNLFVDLAHYTPRGEWVGITEDEARWIAIECTNSSRMVDLHLAGGPRLMLAGKPVAIIPDDWRTP